MKEEVIVPVSALNRYISRLIEKQTILSNLHVEGELANVKRYRSGHIYFSLRDELATVSCVMYKSQVSKLTFEPKDGMHVVLGCRAGFYEKSGSFQLNADQMHVKGIGNLFEQYEQIKEKLKKEGLFDPKLKKKLPVFPKKIGVVTSPSGAVIRDIIHVLRRRWPGFSLLLYPCQVQGEKSAQTIIDGIKTLDDRDDIDIIIIGRGGGSMEDLWSFNNERLAYTIVNAKTPIISAVGHETDFTIADFVADLRAPTPSVAAELAVKEKSEYEIYLLEAKKRLNNSLEKKFQQYKQKLDYIANHTIFSYPKRLLEQRQQTVMLIAERLEQQIKGIFHKRSYQLHTLSAKLDALSPLKVLSRGYGMLSDKDGNIKTSVQEVEIEQRLLIFMKDGEIEAEIKQVKSTKSI